MLKLEIDDNGHFHAFTVSGNTLLVAALFGAGINATYNHLTDAHPDAGADFRKSMDAVMRSGKVWDSDLTRVPGQGFTIVEFKEMEDSDGY